MVYNSQEDALAAENAITFTSAGVNSKVQEWPLSTKFFIEQLDFDAKVDCAGFYDGTATATISGQSRFNGQQILMQGDGVWI